MGWFFPKINQNQVEDGFEQLLALDLDIPIEIRSNKRARRLSLRLDAARRKAVLTVPRGVSKTDQKAFLTRHYAWLKAQVAALPEVQPFKDGAIVPLRGVNHRIEILDKAKGRGVKLIAAEQSDDGLPILRIYSDEEFAPRRLKDWMVKQARKDITQRVQIHAERLDISFTRISVRDQRTRWGSCSSSGALSFSWRLIFTPHHVLDYVCAHEVAHLLEMNHSPRFWARVKQTMPDYEPAKKWLSKHGAKLHAFGADD